MQRRCSEVSSLPLGLSRHVSPGCATGGPRSRGGRAFMSGLPFWASTAPLLRTLSPFQPERKKVVASDVTLPRKTESHFVIERGSPPNCVRYGGILGSLCAAHPKNDRSWRQSARLQSKLLPLIRTNRSAHATCGGEQSSLRTNLGSRTQFWTLERAPVTDLARSFLKACSNE
jgi:hypothetical protein